MLTTCGLAQPSVPNSLLTSRKSEGSPTKLSPQMEGQRMYSFYPNTCNWQNNVVERNLDTLIELLLNFCKVCLFSRGNPFFCWRQTAVFVTPGQSTFVRHFGFCQVTPWQIKVGGGDKPHKPSIKDKAESHQVSGTVETFPTHQATLSHTESSPELPSSTAPFSMPGQWVVWFYNCALHGAHCSGQLHSWPKPRPWYPSFPVKCERKAARQRLSIECTECRQRETVALEVTWVQRMETSWRLQGKLWNWLLL